MIDIAGVFAIGLFALLMTANVGVLGLAAWAWANAIAATHRARAHGVEADVTERTIASADEIVADRKRAARAAYVPPTDDELMQSILAARRNGATEDEREYTTEGNEGIESKAEEPGRYYTT